ncbi:hypothetical protein AGR56_05355 [Clostridium sp. DMHC 10]|uniref:AAA family ATPase n=1 Tax=Clostridium sp. DMHC 10 TaxID=747377 RepID=UPI00069E7D9A|nr:AAA family ATPase [Clostridium sp. DMHC 10]KOF56282.1 hypothetical protein AGR56_05355 [Clostridium sp. DMHC 10]
MIKSIYIDNFKALNDFSIDLKPLTVLIGGNGSGKSTILQAIDLLCNIVKMDIDSYIQSRGWEPSDLKSQLSSSSKRQITFRTTFELDIEENEILLNIDLTVSFMKNIDEEKDKDKYPELCKIKSFLIQSDSFELLSTEKIRNRGSRGKTNDIGLVGEKLASFIHGLSNAQNQN